MSNEVIPVSKHHFQVVIDGVSDESAPQEYFYSVEGLEKTMAFENQGYMPGGYNRPVETPVGQRGGELVLQRYIVEQKSKINDWCIRALDLLQCHPTNVYIFVMNREQDIVAKWIAERCWPASMKGPTLCAADYSGIAKQTIVLKYSRLIWGEIS